MGQKTSKKINLTEWIRQFREQGLSDHEISIAVLAALGAVYGPGGLSPEMAERVHEALKADMGAAAPSKMACEEMISHMMAPTDNGSDHHAYTRSLAHHATPVLHYHTAIATLALAGSIRHTREMGADERAELAAKTATTAASPKVSLPTWFTFDNMLKLAKAILSVVAPLLTAFA